MSTKTNGEKIYHVTTEDLAQGGLSWKNCVSIYTDGAAALTGRLVQRQSLAESKHKKVRTTHCFLHRETSVAKKLLKDPSDVLDRAVDMAQPLKTGLFLIFPVRKCEQNITRCCYTHSSTGFHRESFE